MGGVDAVERIVGTESGVGWLREWIVDWWDIMCGGRRTGVE